MKISSMKSVKDISKIPLKLELKNIMFLNFSPTSEFMTWQSSQFGFRISAIGTQAQKTRTLRQQWIPSKLFVNKYADYCSPPWQYCQRSDVLLSNALPIKESNYDSY